MADAAESSSVELPGPGEGAPVIAAGVVQFAIPKIEPDEWIGVDFDGTLVLYVDGMYPEIGAPILIMVERVRAWLAAGVQVRIFTARCSWLPGATKAMTRKRQDDAYAQKETIREWTIAHLGQPLAVTCEKDYKCRMIWDDRAVQMVPNTGVPLAEAIAATVGDSLRAPV